MANMFLHSISLQTSPVLLYQFGGTCRLFASKPPKYGQVFCFLRCLKRPTKPLNDLTSKTTSHKPISIEDPASPPQILRQRTSQKPTCSLLSGFCSSQFTAIKTWKPRLTNQIYRSPDLNIQTSSAQLTWNSDVRYAWQTRVWTRPPLEDCTRKKDAEQDTKKLQTRFMYVSQRCIRAACDQTALTRQDGEPQMIERRNMPFPVSSTLDERDKHCQRVDCSTVRCKFRRAKTLNT